MEKPTHYIEANILPLDGPVPSRADIAFATSKLMSCIHLHIVEGNEVAVAFPELQADSKITTTGSKVRVFGSLVALATLLARQDFASLNAGALFRLGKDSIKTVPDATEWETYRRLRNVERSYAGFAEREDRRKAKLSEQGRHAGAKRPEVKAERAAFITMRSSSTGNHGFSMFIGKASSVWDEVGKPTTYGLGVPVPAF